MLTPGGEVRLVWSWITIPRTVDVIVLPVSGRGLFAPTQNPANRLLQKTIVPESKPEIVQHKAQVCNWMEFRLKRRSAVLRRA